MNSCVQRGKIVVINECIHNTTENNGLKWRPKKAKQSSLILYCQSGTSVITQAILYIQLVIYAFQFFPLSCFCYLSIFLCYHY